jgi:hypothetical protein
MIRIALCLWLLTTAALAADVDSSLCRDIDDTTRALVPVDLRPWFKVPHGVKAAQPIAESMSSCGGFLVLTKMPLVGNGEGIQSFIRWTLVVLPDACRQSLISSTAEVVNSVG